MSRANDVVAFSQTIKPLALGPLAGVAVLTCLMLLNSGPHALTLVPLLALRIAPFCYGAAALFVVPILAIWPSMRRPTYSVAVIWGVLSALAALALLTRVLGQSIRVNWEALPFGAAGAASGLLYAYAMGRRSHADIGAMTSN